MNEFNLTAVYIANLIGILLLTMILFSRGWSLSGRKNESRLIFVLVIATIIDCLMDPFVFTFDGNPGELSRLIVFVGNTLLFLYNVIVGTGLIALIVSHINKRIPKSHIVVIAIVNAIEILLLVINIFIPIVFTVDENNSYCRGPVYFIYIALAFLLLIYVNAFYFVARSKDSLLRYFPVWEFVMPILIGVILQTLFYGISLQPVCFAIAFCALVICLQNEGLYMDKLTGTYNRYELDMITAKSFGHRRERFTAIMIDMNDFKSINDIYSHNEGDAALVATARILLGLVKNDGVVIRFAGDEFVLIINDDADGIVEEYKKKINQAVDKYNETSNKPYKLSLSIGGTMVDLSEKGGEDFLNTIDALMYENKAEYYKTHDRRRRD